MLVKFYSATVLAAISNTDYEGSIKDVGDKVIIRTTPDITIRRYYKNANLIHQRPESTNVEMRVDYGEYFDFICDDIDKHQSDIKLMDDWSTDAGEQMKIAVDTRVLADVYADANAYNKGATAGKKSGDINLGVSGTPLGMTKANITDVLVDCATCLTEQDVPITDRWFVAPSWFTGMLKKSQLADASFTGDGESVLRNGRIGVIDGFTIYSSNLIASVTDGSYTAWHAMAGQRKALSFASQMTKTETLRAESTFGNIVRGLNVYGYKVLKGEALCDVYVRKA